MIKVLTWWGINNHPFIAALNNDKEETKMSRNDHPHKFEGHILTVGTVIN